MDIGLVFGLLIPFAFTFTVATIRSRRRNVEEPIISTIQGAC
ncbi:MAG TPA: hypothetical protein VHB97_11760 [Polyangia bacterium]|jgi:hypothetical protein|nr:hypothetical protein [Polyangia bacterium]